MAKFSQSQIEGILTGAITGGHLSKEQADLAIDLLRIAPESHYTGYGKMHAKHGDVYAKEIYHDLVTRHYKGYVKNGGNLRVASALADGHIEHLGNLQELRHDFAIDKQRLKYGIALENEEKFLRGGEYWGQVKRAASKGWSFGSNNLYHKPIRLMKNAAGIAAIGGLVAGALFLAGKSKGKNPKLEAMEDLEQEGALQQQAMLAEPMPATIPMQQPAAETAPAAESEQPKPLGFGPNGKPYFGAKSAAATGAPQLKVFQPDGPPEAQNAEDASIAARNAMKRMTSASATASVSAGAA